MLFNAESSVSKRLENELCQELWKSAIQIFFDPEQIQWQRAKVIDSAVKMEFVEEYDVIIVGAGMAGLGAAQYLCNNSNLRMLTLEARDRPGGRTHTVESHKCNMKIDLGGQFIGPGQHRILSLIAKYGLTLIEQEFSHAEQTCNRLVELVNIQFEPLSDEGDKEIPFFIDYIAKVGKDLDVEAPWTVENAAYLDGVSVLDFVDANIKTYEAKTEILMFVQTVMACDPRECSFLFFLFNVTAGGGMDYLGDGPEGAQKWKVKSGTQQISELWIKDMKTHFSDRFDIEFNSPVNRITQLSDKKLVVELTNGRQVRCAHVVVSLSPVLAASHLTFTPPLPQEKSELCEKMVRGHCIKLIVAFSQPFWEASESQQGNPVVYHTLQKIGYVQNLFASKAISDTGSQLYLLTGFITGSTNVNKFSSLNAEERRATVLSQLSSLYSSTGEHDSVIFSPIDYYEVHWGAEEYSGGCFCGVLPPGLLTRCGSHLRESTHGGCVHWASTETATAYYGYMEGAILSGERAAAEIVVHSN